MANKYLNNSGLTYFWNRLKLLFTNSLAPVETSPSLSNHGKGEFIIYNHRLYKVTSPIASGDALSTSSNIEATKYSDEVFFMQGKVRKTISPSSSTTIGSMGVASIDIPLGLPSSEYKLESVYTIRTGSPYGFVYGFYCPSNDKIRLDIKNVSSNTLTVTPTVGVVLGREGMRG